MTGPLGWVRKAAGMLLPWPPKHQRDEAIAAARREKERSQLAARHAAAIEAQLRQMSADNHFAAALARQIMGRGTD